jgi:membrane-associated phospholipid phosphatase
MIYIIIGVRMGKFTDIDVSVRSQRVGPFLFGTSLSVVGLLTLFFTHGPKNLTTLLLITTIGGILMMLITLWWKISLHAASLASSVTLLAILYGTSVLPAFLLVALVSWSRVVLRRHTVGQVLAGAGVNIVLVVVVVQLRGV